MGVVGLVESPSPSLEKEEKQQQRRDAAVLYPPGTAFLVLHQADGGETIPQAIIAMLLSRSIQAAKFEQHRRRPYQAGNVSNAKHTRKLALFV